MPRKRDDRFKKPVSAKEVMVERDALILLRRSQGLTTAQIAVRLGVSQAVVYQACERSKRAA